MFKVILKRKAPPGTEKALLDLITQLRIGASGQYGYISGETLRNSACPDEFVVISVWDDEESWQNWLTSDERVALQQRIDALIGVPTMCETYQYPHMTHTV